MKNQPVTSIRHQQGSVTLIIAFTMVVIIAFAGLAIDTGRSYGVKAQLSAAADAGALAGARALAQGPTQAERIANAEATALRYFNLNYPDGFQSSTVSAPIVNVVPLGSGRWGVTVNANADTTTTFMRVLGKSGGEINSVAQAIRINPDIMMVLDSSGSMKGKIQALKDAAKDGFVSKFIPDDDGDRLGVITYAAGSELNEPIDKTATRGFSTTAVEGAIDSLADGGWTVTSDAMRKALDELNAIPLNVRSDLRVMLVFSDGAPNVFAVEQGGQRANLTRTGNYRDPDSRNSAGTNLNLASIPLQAVGGVSATNGPLNWTTDINDRCNITKATRNLTENVAAMARQQGIVIYTIGLGNQLLDIEKTTLADGTESTCGMDSTQIGANLLRRLANTDDQNNDFVPTEPRGEFCFAEQTSDLENCFSKIASSILRLTM